MIPFRQLLVAVLREPTKVCYIRELHLFKISSEGGAYEDPDDERPVDDLYCIVGTLLSDLIPFHYSHPIIHSKPGWMALRSPISKTPWCLW
jgi:hypothetical protein